MRKWMTRMAGAAGLAGVVLVVRALVGPGTRGRTVVRRGGDQLARSVRNRTCRWKGVSYRLRGRHPAPDVTDDVLADRIRSSIGRLEVRLDVPHIHLPVQDGTALLHGEVGTADDAEQLERAVAAVSGVVGVESFLHIGLIRGDTRPSEGAQHPASSAARTRLLEAATRSGVAEEHASAVVRSVLSTFAERIPTDERSQLATHLPGDVRALIAPPRRTGRATTRIRTVPELVATAAAAAPGGMPPEQHQRVVASVLGTLRELVPEEATDLAAVLPPDLRGFWEAAVPS